MGAVTKTIVRAGVITALAGGAALVIAGPHRVGAALHQAKNNVNAAIDQHIDDPVALRAQVKQLEAQYPKRIAQVRTDLAEVQSSVAELDRERKVAEKVVALAAADLNQADAVLAQAQATQSANQGAIVKVAFTQGSAMSMDKAVSQRNRISQTVQLYTSRATDLATELQFLGQQEEQLTDLLAKLEAERAELQAKVYELEIQIDSIARNERLIEQLEDRQATIDKLSRYEANSIDQLSKKLDTIRAEQRSRIESVAGREQDMNYEEQAEYLIDSNGNVQPTEAYEPTFFQVPETIEVSPQDVATESIAARD